MSIEVEFEDPNLTSEFKDKLELLINLNNMNISRNYRFKVQHNNQIKKRELFSGMNFQHSKIFE